MLCTLCLNESEWLPKLYQQHKDWKGLTHWCFVESADRIYAETNPDRVVAGGLSIDGTTDWLNDLTKRDDRISHVKFGLTTDPRPEQGKCQSRQQYLHVAEKIKPDYLMVVDADETYTKKAQAEISRLLPCNSVRTTAFMFSQRHLWKPPSCPVEDSPFKNEVIGGYWKIPHLRCWRWMSGMRHQQNHNWPEDRHGNLLNRNVARYNLVEGTPECLHLGYASSAQSRSSKHAYYKARGEGGVNDPKRRWYLECRDAFETWKEGDELPHGAKVIPYVGDVPEAFKEQSNDDLVLRSL